MRTRTILDIGRRLSGTRIVIILLVDWPLHADAVLRAAGYKPGRARTAVIEALGGESCCLTAQEIHDRVRERRARVGIASVYRALETLAELGLVHRLELGSGGAHYEPAAASGDHHHHLVCGGCGRVEPFMDDRLEHAIGKVSAEASFRIDGHDVVLRGVCGACAA
jgi:Fur family transcriptional regulator, ferric uptake regulator